VKPLPLIVIGSGGHAAVVADALLAAGEEVLGFTDVDASRQGLVLCDLPVLGDDASILRLHSSPTVRLVNGIGGVRPDGARRAAQRRLERLGWQFVSVRHPSCIVSPFAHIEPGCQLLAGCIVQAGAHLEPGCIINTASVVEHHVELGEFVHVAPRALLCGDVRIGALSHIGAGAVVRQGVQLGELTLVGAGAVVVNDFEGHGVLLGIPARVSERQR